MRKYVLNGEELFYNELRLKFPNISFPENEEVLQNNFFSSFNIEVVECVPAEPIKTLDDKKNEVRAKRNSMLAESDKYLLEDYPIGQIDRDSIKSWRQYLRDFTANENWWDRQPVELCKYLNNDNSGIEYE